MNLLRRFLTVTVGLLGVFADPATGSAGVETCSRGTVVMGTPGAGRALASSALGRIMQGVATLDRVVAAGIADGATDGLPK